MRKIRLVQIFLIVVFASTGLRSTAAGPEEKWRMVLNLEGDWKFTIGDNLKWASATYSDKDWESIDVPSKWEDEGFYGYDGYGWYRKSFDGTALKNKNGIFNLFLGYIDDVDEVYLNGHKIGASGSFPPRYHTAYNALRNYFIPNEYINFVGKNIIAVRVYDSEIEGGIVSGDVGIFTDEDDHNLLINLRGSWDFAFAFKGSNESLSSAVKRAPPVNTLWTKIPVPASWGSQGYGNYDGSAWYRRQFTIPKELEGEDLILLLGKIDDYDQTYFNGKLIGSTNQDNKLRIYTIPSEMFKGGAVNLLLVYVNDLHGEGGIYEGPVGIMKQSDFTRYIRWKD